MEKYTAEEITRALELVTATIINCEKAQLKFVEGSSQHSLLKNRIKALYISESFLTNESIIGKYTNEELIDALKPISSIISKCEKAQLKFAEGVSHYTRLQKIIKTMYISKLLISNAINKND